MGLWFRQQPRVQHADRIRAEDNVQTQIIEQIFVIFVLIWRGAEWHYLSTGVVAKQVLFQNLPMLSISNKNIVKNKV